MIFSLKRIFNNLPLLWISRGGATLCALTAFVTYLLTLEPTASYWDCPEYIASAACLEAGHPPGNPLFMFAARFCITLLPCSPSVAVNIMSALLSALTIFFLYLTIAPVVLSVCQTRRHKKSRHSFALSQLSAIAGSLIYAWSDTFWFSAVEAEVYAFASFCTAISLWLAMVYSRTQDSSARTRILVLLAYITGISVSVHLLNLLCLPAIALVVAYTHRPRMRLYGALLTVVIGFLLIASILFFILPVTLSICGDIELWAVNTLELPYNSGLLIWVGLFLFISIGIIAYWQQTNCNTRLRRILRSACYALIWLLLGISSYALILIRGNAHPPMNQGTPDNIFALRSYIGREQYPSAPLFYGSTPFSPHLREEKMITDSSGNIIDVSYTLPVRHPLRPKYARFMPNAVSDHRSRLLSSRDSAANRNISERASLGYIITDYAYEYIDAPELNMVMPRLHSANPTDIDAYADWCGMTPALMDSVEASFAIDEKGNLVGRYDPATGERTRQRVPKPTVMQNLYYFFGYQLGYMYLRYFMWNFAGRQNDMPSQGAADEGNFITGIPVVDNAMLGDQSKLPPEIGKENPGHRSYFMIPLILGIIGMVTQWRSGKTGRHDFNIILALFIMTGVAIVIYLNQTPGEPRERDYSFAASFYAWTIWIGLGIAGIWRFLCSRKLYCIAIGTIILIVVGVPLMIFSKNLPDHNRSGRYAARDYAVNLLEGLEQNAIIFVNGDNNTFPLWYAQEVEGVRRDVRVVNMAYLATSWYALQLLAETYSAPPLPLTATPRHLAYGAFSVNYIPTTNSDTIPALNALKTLYATGKLPTNTVFLHNGECIDLRKFASGKSYLSLDRLIILDLLATNGAAERPRPVYWSGGTVLTDFVGMQQYVVRQGLAWRLTEDPHACMRMDTAVTMKIVLSDKFRWGGANDGVYFDPIAGSMLMQCRSMLTDLALELTNNKQYNDARKIILLAEDSLSPGAWRYEIYTRGYNLRHSGAEAGGLMMQIGNALNDTALYNRGVALLKEQTIRGLTYMRYRAAMPERIKNTISTRSRNERTMLYAPIEQFLANNGDTAILRTWEGVKKIDLETERKRYLLNQSYRHLLGSARRINSIRALTPEKYAALPLHVRKEDSIFTEILDRYIMLGGTMSTLNAAKEFEGFRFGSGPSGK